jgi:hypothetical protein
LSTFYLEYTDAQVGCVVDAVAACGGMHNTLIFYVAGGTAPRWKDPLSLGKVRLKLDFAYQGGPKELGKRGGNHDRGRGEGSRRPSAEDHPRRDLDRRGLDIGGDVGSPVDFTYKPPFKFPGKIEKVTFDPKRRQGKGTRS